LEGNKMKLTYIANVRLPTEKAHGLQIMKVCEAFAKAGARVTLVVPRRIQPEKELRGRDPFSYYGVEKNFTIKTVPCVDLIFLENLLGTWTFWLQEFTFSLMVFIYELFRSEDVVYTRDPVVAAWLSGRKKVVFEAHVWPEKGHAWYARWLKKVKLVVINNALRKKFKELVSEGNIFVAHDGVDLKLFEKLPDKERARKELGIPLRKSIAMYTGHLYPWKGIDTVIDTAVLVPLCMFYVVGGTREDVEKYRKIVFERMVNNVVLVGHVNPTLVPRYLAAADVLLLPNSAKYNISREYTSPLKLFEYMASKRPILSSDVPSSTEVLSDGKNAVLFKADDAADCAEKLSKLLKSLKKANSFAAKAFADVKKFTWNARASHILNFISGGFR